MADEHTMTITDTDRLEWLLRYGSPLQIDGGPIQSRAQVDEQIRRSRFRVGRAWEGSAPQSEPVAQNVVPFSVISAANRELAIVIGDLRLRRCS